MDLSLNLLHVGWSGATAAEWRRDQRVAARSRLLLGPGKMAVAQQGAISGTPVAQGSMQPAAGAQVVAGCMKIDAARVR